MINHIEIIHFGKDKKEPSQKDLKELIAENLFKNTKKSENK